MYCCKYSQSSHLHQDAIRLRILIFLNRCLYCTFIKVIALCAFRNWILSSNPNVQRISFVPFSVSVCNLVWQFIRFAIISSFLLLLLLIVGGNLDQKIILQAMPLLIHYRLSPILCLYSEGLLLALIRHVMLLIKWLCFWILINLQLPKNDPIESPIKAP